MQKWQGSWHAMLKETEVSAALATGIRSGRSERREQLPRNIWETWQPRVIEIVGGSVTALSFRLM